MLDLRSSSKSIKNISQVPELPPQFRGCVHAVGTAEVDIDKADAVAFAITGKCPFGGAEAEGSLKSAAEKWGVLRDKFNQRNLVEDVNFGERRRGTG